jgi:hypothetical protein
MTDRRDNPLGFPNSNDPVESGGCRLSPADAAALDRRLEHAASVNDDSDSGIARVLALLEIERQAIAADQGESKSADQSAVDSTLSRLAEMDRAGEPRVFALSEADAAAVDAVLASDPSAVETSVDADRLESARSAFGLLDQLPAATNADIAGRIGDAEQDDLVGRTMTAVADARQRERFAQQVQMFADPPRSLGLDWRQFGTVAAVLLLGLSVLMPVLDRNKAEAQRVACASNLAAAGMAMAGYAADSRGVLPRGPISVGDPWLNVGQPDALSPAGNFQSNSAHLFLLIREGYLPPDQLACTANSDAVTQPIALGQFDWSKPSAVSYSYQNQYTPRPLRLDRALPSLAILADKNPLFVAVNGRIVFDPHRQHNSPSQLHNGEGQNVLSLDGNARWTAAPRFDEDVIWIIANKKSGYVGNEHPADAGRDSFLVP